MASFLSPRSKFAIARSRINFAEIIYEMLNKEKLSLINYKDFFLLVWQTISVNFYGSVRKYLITWNSRDTLISWFWGSHISRHLIFAI